MLGLAGQGLCVEYASQGQQAMEAMPRRFMPPCGAHQPVAPAPALALERGANSCQLPCWLRVMFKSLGKSSQQVFCQ